MTHTKQTVYLPVNDEQDKVVCNDYPDWMDRITGVIEKEGYFFTPEQLNEYTQNVIKDALNTAAEKAKTYPKEEYNEREGIYEYPLIVSKSSITSTFEETYQKHKV